MVSDRKQKTRLVSRMIAMAEYSEEGDGVELRGELEEYLLHDDLGVRRTAAITLGKLQISESLPALQQAGRSPEMLATTLHAIRQINGVEAARLAARTLQHGPGSARIEAMRIIRDYGDATPDVIATLERISETGEGVESRVAERILRATAQQCTEQVNFSDKPHRRQS